MALTHIPLLEITEDNLNRLQAAKAAESLHIEYKRDTYGAMDDSRREFLADISSFANAAGGDLVIGMSAVKGVPTNFHPFTGDADAEVLRLEQMARDGLSPRIANLRTVAVPLSQGGYVIVVRIPKSYNPPHRVIFKNSGRFWVRSSVGKYELNVDELRRVFTDFPLLAQRIRSFRIDRTAKISIGDTPVGLLDGCNLVLHVVPFSAFDLGNVLPLGDISKSLDRFPPIGSNSVRGYKFTLDGLLTASNIEGLLKPQRAYVQVFGTGAVEAVVSSLALGSNHDLLVLPRIEKQIVQYARTYAASLRKFGTEPPVAILVSLLNVKGMRLLLHGIETVTVPEDVPGEVLDRDQFHFVESILESVPQNDQECGRQLRATLDHMANAAGHPSSLNFDTDGTYTLPR